MKQATYSEFRFASQLGSQDSPETRQRTGLPDLLVLMSIRRRLILALAGLGLLVGIAFGAWLPPVFSATVEILLPAGDGLQARKVSEQSSDLSIVDSEMQVVRSISVLTSLVEKVGVVQADRWTARRLPPFIAELLPRKPVAELDAAAVVRAVRAALAVSRKDKTAVILLTASAGTAGDAAALANAAAANYIASRSDARGDAARSANAWLKDRLAALKADADAKVAAVAAYRMQSTAGPPAEASSGGPPTTSGPQLGARDEIKLRDMQRQADAALDVYNQYLAQSGAAGSPAAAWEARIVSPALPPERQSSAPIWIWALFGLAAGTLLGSLFAILRSALNNRLMRPADIERKLGQTALVSIPMVSTGELRQFSPDERTPASLIVAKPMSRLAERMRMLLSQVVSLSIDGHGVVIAVTSAIADEGATTTSVSLGRVAAMGGLRTLMIEGDLRMRTLSEILGEGGDRDLIAALTTEADWRTALFLDPATQAHILPAMGVSPIAGNLFASPRIRKILEEARAEYDLVILDCPPVLAIADTRTLCGLADGTLMVASWNATPAPTVRAAVQAIQASGGRITGVILNRLQPSLASQLAFGDALYDGATSARYFAG